MATNVAVTGAAGQIGYAILFRIASGQMLGPDEKVAAAPAGDPAGGQGRRGHRAGAGRLRVPAARRRSTSTTTRTRRSTASTSRCSSARARARKGMERADLLEANGAIFKPQGEALNAGAADDVQDPRRRQPGQHERADRAGQRARHPARALHRDDAARREPRRRAARRRRSASASTTSRTSSCGATTRRRCSPTSSTRRSTASAPSSRSTWTGTRTTTCRASASAARRSSRRAARRRRRSAANAAIDHVHDWVLGADGLRSMAVPLRRPVRHRRGAHLARCRCAAPAAATRSSRGSRSATSRRRKIDARVAELRASARPVGPGADRASV